MSLTNRSSALLGNRRWIDSLSVEQTGVTDDVSRAIEAAMGVDFASVGAMVSNFTDFQAILGSLNTTWLSILNAANNAATQIGGVGTMLQGELYSIKGEMEKIPDKLDEIPGKIDDLVDRIPTFTDLQRHAEDATVGLVNGVFTGMSRFWEQLGEKLGDQIEAMDVDSNSGNHVRAQNVADRIAQNARTTGQSMANALTTLIQRATTKAGLILVELNREGDFRDQYRRQTTLQGRAQVVFRAMTDMFQRMVKDFAETWIIPGVERALAGLRELLIPAAAEVWNILWGGLSNAMALGGAHVLSGLGIQRTWGGINKFFGINHPAWQVVSLIGASLLPSFFVDRAFVWGLDRAVSAGGEKTIELLGRAKDSIWEAWD